MWYIWTMDDGVIKATVELKQARRFLHPTQLHKIRAGFYYCTDEDIYGSDSYRTYIKTYYISNERESRLEGIQPQALRKALEK